MVDAVNTDSLVWCLQRLSGEVAVDTGSGSALILSRHRSQPGNAMAAAWIEQQLVRLGYSPWQETFGASGANVLAMKAGLVHPGRRVYISAHYDCMPGLSLAPGADDDGSGVCAVLEAARVMAQHDFANSVVLAFWDEEEQGLLGSGYHASSAAATDQQIAGVVQMDAIGYDGDGDGLARVHVRPVANSMALKDSVLMVNGTYGLDLAIAVNNPGAVYSDHASFWNEGYGAVLLIEDFDNDPNPYYHTANDRLEHLDTAYWRGMARLAIGTAAALAQPMETVGTSDQSLADTERVQLLPNPAHGQVEVSTARAPRKGTQLLLRDATGREVLHRAMQGTRTLLDLSGIPAGTYFIEAIGTGMVPQRLVVLP